MPGNDIGPRIGIDGEAEFRRSISAINAQMKALGAEMKAVTAEFAANANSEEALTTKNDVLSRSVQTAKDAMGLLDAQLDRQKQKLAALGAELDKVIAAEGANSTAAAKAQNAYNQQYAVVGRLESQYQSARGQLAGFQNALDGVEDSSTRASQALSAQDVLAGVGAWSAIEGAVRAAAAAMEDAIQISMEFDSAMADVAATMGTSVDSLAQMRDFALDMGASTAFTATQAAQALNYMALAGYDAETAMSTLPTVLDLAAAGGVELASASDMITDAQSALGLSLEETTRLVDEMAQTSTKTNTSVAQLGEAILTVGGTAQFMAGGTAELNQVLGVLADNSIKGAEGGTKLRNIILSLTSPTEKAAATLEKLGVSAFDAEGQMREFSDIFPELQRSLSALTSQEQIAALSEIFNSRDIAAAQALLGTTAERWDELTVAIDGAEGAASRMAETRLDNLAGDLTLLQSAADGAKIAFADSLTPAIRDAVQTATGLFSSVGDLVKEFPVLGNLFAGAVTTLGTLAAGMGAVGAATALTGGAVTTLTGAVGALTTVLATNPIGQIAIAAGVGVAGITALSAAIKDCEAVTSQVGGISRETAATWDYMKESAEGAAEGSEVVKEAMSGLAVSMKDVAQKAEDIANGTDTMGDVISPLSESIADLEKSTLYAAGAADTLSDALKEQEKQGSLSYDTAQKLIEAGYAAALAIDEETGAVTLNREEYVRLASAKIQEQIATLEAQKASAAAAAALEVERSAAYNAGSAYWEAAKSKAAMAAAGDTQALDLQIAALNRAQNSLNSYGGAATSAARRSSGASKKIKTQAEKDLEEYKTLKAALDHEKNMDLVDEADYYSRLAELRDRYLADSANLSEYNKASEAIYKAEQKTLQEREKLWQTAGDNIIKLEEDFQTELSARASEIVSSYKLFDAVPEYQKAAGTELIANLEDQIAAIESFYGNVAALENRGVDAALVEDIRSMGVKASGELQGLLELTDDQLTQYSQLYGEKQELANRLAADELKSLREETDQAILAQMDSVGELYDSNAPALGLSFSTALAQGMLEGMPQVEEMAQNVANSAMTAFRHAYNRDVEAMMTQPKQRVTSGEIGQLLAGAVNGLTAGGQTQVAQPMNITLQTRDGIEIARAFLPDIRQAGRETPETLDD